MIEYGPPRKYYELTEEELLAVSRPRSLWVLLGRDAPLLHALLRLRATPHERS